METKDLILLLMIPLLVIGMVVFVNHNSITGNAVAEQNDNEKLGTYSVMPSFRAKIDYSLQDYNDLNNKLKNAIDKCVSSKQQDIKNCIKTETDKPEYQWRCSDQNSDVLYDFTDKLKECINLKEENAVCRFSFDKRDYINKEKPRRDFQIKITNWYYPRVKAELMEDDKILATEFIELGKLDYTDYESKDKDGKNIDSVVIKVHYENGIPTVTDTYTSVGGKPIKLSKLFLFYKSKNDVKFIDQNFESLFRSPQPADIDLDLPNQKVLKYNTIIDLPRMQGLKFCAKTGKKIIAYDSSDGQVKEREIIYKFAITLPNPVPAPVGSFEVKDNLKSEDSTLIIWKKDPQADIKSYSIYYSAKDFAEIKMSDIHKDTEVKKVSVSLDNAIEIDKIDLDNCELRFFNKPCEYSIYNNPLLKNKLHYIKSEDKFVYVLSGSDFKDGIEYNIAVTAVNDKNEEIDNDKSIPDNKNVLEKDKNYLTFSSIDDLSPGKVENLQADISVKGKVKLIWNLPIKNVDGTGNKDVYAFNVYYKDQALLLNSLPGYDRVLGSIPKTSCTSTCEYIFNTLTPGRIYLFAVTAIDLNKNEYFVEGGFSTTTGMVQ